MAFAPMKLKPESGAKQIRSADDAYAFMMYMRFLIETNRIGRWRSKLSITRECRKRVKFRLGEHFEPRPEQKAGLKNKPAENAFSPKSAAQVASLITAGGLARSKSSKRPPRVRAITARHAVTSVTIPIYFNILGRRMV